MKTIKFSKHYSKLNDNQFTTIRKHKKDILDKTVKIRSPNTEFQAQCIKIEKTSIMMINFDLLKKDTDTETIIDGLRELRKHYHDLLMNDTVYVYYFEKQKRRIK